MGPGCSFALPIAQSHYWCPKALSFQSKSYQWYRPYIARGKLYGVRVKVRAYAPDGTSASDAADFPVQF
jgi:hypothetical protein